MPTEIQYGGLSWGFVGKLPLVSLHLSRGNRRLVAPYILLSSSLSIVSYLGGSVMRGASALIAADHLNRFSNGSPSLILVARDWHVLWPDLGLALASLYPDSARDLAGDLWRYLVTNGGVKKIKEIKTIINKNMNRVPNKVLFNQLLLHLDSPV